MSDELLFDEAQDFDPDLEIEVAQTQASAPADGASVSEVMKYRLQTVMRVFVELYRVLKPGGYCLVGIASLRPRKLRWDEVVLECALAAKFEAVAIIINTAFGGQGLLERPYMVRRSDFDEAIIVWKPEPSWSANPR